jgi:LacI family transcriptional regulator
MSNVTLKEIAKIVGVSAMTVSRVINNKENIKKETRGRIIDAVKKYGYEQNTIARGLKIKSTKNIGFILGDIENPYYSRLSKGIIRVCEASNYNVIVCNSNYDVNLGAKYIDMLIQKIVDGLLISTINLTEESIEKINNRNIPFVLITCKLDSPNVNFYMDDDYYGGQLVAEYLVKLGHRKIFYLRSTDVFGANQRLNAFKDTMKKNNIFFDNTFFSNLIIDAEEGYMETKKFLEKKDGFTAVIAGNDFLATGAMEAIFDAGLRIPDDISIIGYDNLRITSILKVPLTTIRQPKLSFGELAAQRLIEMIENPESRNNPVRIIEKPELIIRESCKRIN